MRQERASVVLKAGAMALSTGLLAATAWAQPPAPAPAPTATVVPVPGVYCTNGQGGAMMGGGLGNAFQHAGQALQDGLIGYPEEFNEPPVGFFIHETYKVMSAKADPHRFTLYKTDFLPGTNLFSPVGATRFNLMAARVTRWPGAILIEWSPDEPGLAEARRAAVVSLFERAHIPVTADRVVIAPSPFPGLLGVDAANLYNVQVTRVQAAPGSYSYTPTSASGFGGGGGGGGGGGR
jgi:hypothetical protein